MTDYDAWLTADTTGDRYVPVARDLYKDDIYIDDYVFDTGTGLVLQRNMKQYIIDKNELQDGANGWALYFDGMQGNIEEYDTILFDGDYLSEDTITEYLAHIEWQPVMYIYL